MKHVLVILLGLGAMALVYAFARLMYWLDYGHLKEVW